MHEEPSGVWIMAYTTIDDSSAHFSTILYTGDGSGSLVISGVGFQPDFSWIKERSSTSGHHLFNSSIGYDKALASDSSNGDSSQNMAVASDGYTLGSSGGFNEDTQTYVGWNWLANGGTTTAVSASGDVQASTYQANTTAGFSILTWEGTGENKQITHGLGKQADWIMVKNRSQTDSWAVWSYARANQSASASFILNTTAASSATPNPFDGNLGTASIFWINGGDHEVNADGENYAAYAWTDIQGYSKFGLYLGNGNVDGPFIYTGFKPAYVLIKKSSATGSWYVLDHKRNTYNPLDLYLQPDITDADTGSGTAQADFLSNGFKIRVASGTPNLDGGTFIYMAFAENPFVTSGGVPCTAR